MSQKQSMLPFVAQVITSNQTRNVKRAWFEVVRHLLPSRNAVTFFHRVDDPYSYLLLQALPRLLQDFKIRLNLHFVLDLPDASASRPQAYALRDSARLAAFHGLSFPETPQQPSAKDAFIATSLLVKHKDSPKLLHLALEVTGALWKDSTTTFESCVKRYGMTLEQETRTATQNSAELLQRLGHFSAATLYYGSEWYWGLDRLGHLAERLNRPGMRRSHEDIADYQRQYRHVLQSYNTLKPRPRQLKTMEFYFSFASPYSYLAAGRLFKLQELYQFPLSLRPVMPNGNGISPEKALYILRDAKRESLRFNIPFGKVRDPLPEGIERCMALFPWAEIQGRAKPYILSVMTGIWAEGVDVSTDAGLRKLVERAGLAWDAAQAELQSTIWQKLAADNRAELDALAVPGVPVMRYGELMVWGQDRLWAIEQEMLINRAGNR